MHRRVTDLAVIFSEQFCEPVRAPPMHSPGSLDDCNVFVKYLPHDLTDRDFYKMFKAFGTVVSSKIMVDQASGKSLGYGFVFSLDLHSPSTRLHLGSFCILIVEPGFPSLVLQTLYSTFPCDLFFLTETESLLIYFFLEPFSFHKSCFHLYHPSSVEPHKSLFACFVIFTKVLVAL